MAGTEQLQVDSLLQCLHGCLVNDPDVRKEAEAALAAGAERPGFGVALARLLLQSDLQYGMRQLAAVLLKQYIKQHWVEASLLFAGFPTSEEDKGALRQLLLPALSDAHSKLRVSAGVCVACIAQWDWPDLWPELLPFLIDSIRARRSHAAVHGALSCLALVAEDVREELIPAALNHLLPELQAMVSMHCQRQQQQQQGAGAGEDEEEADRVSHMARKALSIFRQLLSLTFSMPNELRRAIRDQMVPVLPAWMQLLSALLRAPMQAEAVGDWGVRMEALRLACRLLVAGLGKALAPHVPALLQDAWQLLASALPLYQRDVVAGESQDHGFQDSEGDAMDLESLCCQLYELLLTVVGVERYQPLLQDSLKPLLGVTLQYMQLTQPQLAAWAHEVEQYVQDEEVEGLFGGSLRSTCQCLLAELVTVYESTALAALSAAVQQALAESAEMRSRGEAAWWRLQESSFLAVGAVAMELRDMDGSGSGSGRRRSRKAAAPPGLDAAAVLEAVVLPEISGAAAPLPLLGRALWVVARYAWLVPPNRQLAYLQACTIGLQDGMPAAVAIASFRSCTAFLSRLQAEQVRPFLPRLYQAVSSMLGTASADALPLLLEALAAIVRCDEATATACEPQVSPALLQLWRSYADHPDILPAALEVLHAFVAFPSCIPGLASRCVPPLVQVLASFRTQAPAAAHIVAGALDLLTVLAVPGNRAAARHIFQEAAPHAVNLLIASGDPAVVQNATELLVALVSAGRAELLGGWSVPEAAAGQLPEAASARKQTLDAFLRAVDFLLRRDLGDSPSLRAGELLGVMLMHWPADMAPYVPKLLAAAAGKLAATGSAPVIVSLLGAMCDVAVQDADSFISLMASTSVPDQDGRVVPALPLLLQIWTDHHLDFYGEYAVHRSVSGLIALTATRRPEILAIQIQRPNPAAAAAAPEGVMTRAKARMLKSQARTAATVAVPFPQRLFAILSETLHDEMQRERSADDGMVLGLPEDLLLDDDEDWEEEEDKDGDEDEEEIDDDEGAGPALAVHGIGRGMSLLEEEDCHPQPSRTASGGNRSEIHLLTYLKEQIRGIVAADPDFVQSCAHLLTAAQKAAVEATITDAGP